MTAIISPHIDDETLGVGGTLLKRGGDIIYILAVNETDKDYRGIANHYHFRHTELLNYPDCDIDTIPIHKIVSDLSDIFNRYQPDTVYLPYLHDVHSDHRFMAQATLAATKVFRTPYIHNLYMYETMSQTDLSMQPFHPNAFVDISSTLSEKLAAFRFFSADVCQARDEEGIKALAVIRGKQAGVKYAEAFMKIREVR